MNRKANRELFRILEKYDLTKQDADRIAELLNEITAYKRRRPDSYVS